METSEIRTKRKVPVWAVLAGALVLVAAVVVISLSISSGSKNRKVTEKLALADRYLSELKYEEAIALYNEVLEIEPRDIGAYEGLLNAYISLNRLDDAKEIISIIRDMYKKLPVDEKKSDYGTQLKGLIEKYEGVFTTEKENYNATLKAESGDSQECLANKLLCMKTTIFNSDGSVYCVFKYEYDNEYRMVMKTQGDQYGIWSFTEFEYNNNGILAKSTKFTPDRKVLQTVELASVEANKIKYYADGIDVCGYIEYNEDGSASGVCRNGTGTPDYVFECNKNGQILSVKHIDEETGDILSWVEYVYDSDGTTIERIYHESKSCIGGDVHDIYTYNPDGSWKDTFRSNDEIIYIHEYYSNGNIKKAYNYYGADEPYVEDFEYSESGDDIKVLLNGRLSQEYIVNKEKKTFTTKSYGVYGDVYYQSELQYPDEWSLHWGMAKCDPIIGRIHYEFGGVRKKGNYIENNALFRASFTGSGFAMLEEPLWVEYEFDDYGNVVKLSYSSMDRKESVWAQYEYSEIPGN